MCAPVEEDGTYGAFYVKPYESFNKKASNFNVSSTDLRPMDLQGNLYQKLMNK
jgi:hypothetical protein